MPQQEGLWAPLGYAQFSVDASTAKTLASTVAQGTNVTTIEGADQSTGKRAVRVEVTPEQNVRFRLDGTAPTSAIGTLLLANTQYIVTTDPRKFGFISASGTATVNVEFLGF